MPSGSGPPAWARLVSRALRHPADRSDRVERGHFEHLAEFGSFLASSPFFFAVCLLVIVAWIVGLLVGASDRFEVAGAGLISALTLVLVALLKNAELRSERAIQQKLDAIAGSLLQDRRGGDDVESERDLEQAIGLHEEI
jgi:low affinity Fe/Cu permease